MTTRPGGALTVLAGLLRAWRRADDVELMVLASVPQTIQTLHDLQLDIHVESNAARRGPISRAVWQRFFTGFWLRDHHVDVLINNNHYLSGVSCPQVVHHHNLWRFMTPELGIAAGRGWRDRLRDRAARRALHRAAANVFVSQFLRTQAEQFVPDSSSRYHVVPNCLDDVRVGAPVSSAPTSDTRTLLAVQSANPHKDNLTLVCALAQLRGAAPMFDWRLEFAGSAGRADWAPVRQLAEQLGVAAHIDWLGFLDRHQLNARLRAAFCLVASSRLESSGLTLIEAMAVGCPVVATRIGAFEEYAGDAALLFSPGHAEELAAAVKRLEEPELRERLIGLGRQRAQRYRWSEWSPKFLEIVRHAATLKSPRSER
ncbi:MAG: glycosyltransferase family 4 protein [Pirellulales bacterium]|nr:glycosyltransferase family 4 protein [Pirellulales bacterium]